jgi:hypothetical protein
MPPEVIDYRLLLASSTVLLPLVGISFKYHVEDVVGESISYPLLVPSEYYTYFHICFLLKWPFQLLARSNKALIKLDLPFIFHVPSYVNI